MKALLPIAVCLFCGVLVQDFSVEDYQSYQSRVPDEVRLWVTDVCR